MSDAATQNQAAYADFTSSSSDSVERPAQGRGVFDFLSEWASNPWDFATATVETVGETIGSLGSSGFEALPDVTIDTGDVPDPTDVNLWPVAIAGVAVLGLAVWFTK